MQTRTAQPSLRAVSDYNRALIEASIDGLLTIDEAMRVADVNQALCTMTGRAREQLIGSDFRALFTEPERAAEGLRQTFSSGAVSDYVLTLRRPDGALVPVSFNASTYTEPAGGRHVFAAARDISAAVRLESELRDVQLYTRSLIEASVDAMMTTDPGGVITDVNRRMEELTGRTREELIGSPFKQYFTDPEAAERGIRLVMERGQVTDYELVARSSAGREVTVSYNATTYADREGRTQGVFAAARDITERRQAELRLREANAYHRGLIEASLDGLLTLGETMAITDVNESLCRMAGLTREKLVGAPFPPLFTEPERAAAGVRQTFERGAVTDYVLTLRAAGGGLVPVSFNASTYTQPGHGRRIFAAARDITEVQRREAAVAQLAAIVEASADAIYSNALDGTILTWNPAAEALFGYGAAEAVGHSVSMLVPAGHLDEAQPLVDAFRRGERVIPHATVDVVRRRKDGRSVDVSLTISPIRDAGGSMVAVSRIARDVSAQKQAERALREAEARYRGIFESALEGIFRTGVAGRFELANPAMARILGYDSPAELMASVTDIGARYTDPRQRQEILRRLERSDSLTGVEIGLRRRDGAEVWVAMSSRAVRDAAGRLVSIEGTAVDITERRRAQAAVAGLNAELEERVRQRTAELEAANRELESFTYSVSHDLRAPLRAIAGFSQILQEDHASQLDPEGRRLFGVVIENTRQMGKLIDDLLAFSRTSRKALEREVVDMRAIAASVVAELKQLEPERRIEVEIGDLGPARCDPALIRQVWANLVANALKFTRPRPVARIEIGRLADPGTTTWYVRDNGVGFEMRYAAKLFQVFQRLHSAAEFEGTGIGLAIANRVVQRHGGAMRAEGTVDKGATFYFSLPEQGEKP